jgi:SAM-dependent methyltransferase
LNRPPSDLLEESRKYWWNQDFLRLMVERWRFPKRASVLDVGAGLGHWSRALAPVTEVRSFTLVDSDEETLRFANGLASDIGPSYLFVGASALALPFRRECFDVVTCQTLLIHLENPRRALEEMLRVLRPNGLLICVEPYDLLSCARLDVEFLEESPETLIEHFSFWVRYYFGRRMLGQGDLNFGAALPTIFQQLGLSQVKAFQSDKLVTLVPPYATMEQEAFMSRQVSPGRKHRSFDISLEKTVMAGGGRYDLVRSYLRASVARETHRRELALEKKLITTWGSGLYLVSGRKA